MGGDRGVLRCQLWWRSVFVPRVRCWPDACSCLPRLRRRRWWSWLTAFPPLLTGWSLTATPRRSLITVSRLSSTTTEVWVAVREPRGEINPWIQARGYRDALDVVSACDRVAQERVALWGDSYSAAQVLAVACVDERVRAVVAQTPACGRHPAPPDPDGDLYRGMRARLLHGSVRAEPEGWRGPMPVVSLDQLSAPSALKPLTALRWFLEYGARFGSGWENQVVLTSPEEPMWLPVLWAQHVLVPTCFLLARDDEMPGSTTVVARQAFAALGGPKEVHELEGGHFGLLYHPGPVFERSVAIQTRFLRSWLQPDETPNEH